MNKVKLSEIPVGTSAVLVEFETTPLHLHLLAMGIGPGMIVKLVRRFPMHGSLYIQIGNRHVVMRSKEAGQLQVTKAN
ncbi:MAG TPA: FeoA family protein [Saprospiraceae bacterium]|nr:FeoA family protein [Saprospiraceae bacterium]